MEFFSVLPRHVQTNILSFKSNALSLRYTMPPLVHTFLVVSDDVREYAAVTEEGWRAMNDAETEDDAGDFCEVCTLRKLVLAATDVGYVRLALHLRTSYLPRTEAATDIIHEHIRFEERMCCTDCEALLW